MTEEILGVASEFSRISKCWEQRSSLHQREHVGALGSIRSNARVRMDPNGKVFQPERLRGLKTCEVSLCSTAELLAVTHDVKTLELLWLVRSWSERVCSVRLYLPLTYDSPGKDFCNHMKIISSQGYGLHVCVCVLPRKLHYPFFFFFLVYFHPFLCFLLTSAHSSSSCSSYPWTRTLTPQSTQCLCLWTVGGKPRRRRKRTETPGIKPRTFSQQGPFSFQLKLSSTRRQAMSHKRLEIR